MIGLVKISKELKMSNLLIAIVALIYAATALSNYMEGHAGMSIVFLAYGLGNIGLILANKGI